MKFVATVTTILIGSAAAFTSVAPDARLSNTALNLKVGETAPDFALKDQNGKTVTRSQIKKPLVVYFYPADATPVRNA
jgi:thioredoxin-dependent peroxiredoxin